MHALFYFWQGLKVLAQSLGGALSLVVSALDKASPAINCTGKLYVPHSLGAPKVDRWLGTLLLFAAALGLHAQSVDRARAGSAGVLYRCIGSSGQVTYTNVPEPGCVVVSVYQTKGRSTSPTPARQLPVVRDDRLLNAGTYLNREGSKVHQPSRTESGLPPSSATAKCRDGTYSFSRGPRGTCSHHGGVASWLAHP